MVDTMPPKKKAKKDTPKMEAPAAVAPKAAAGKSNLLDIFTKLIMWILSCYSH